MRCLVVLALCAAVAHAAPDERTDTNRYLQLLPIAVGGAGYLVLELGVKDAITPQECKWCRSNALDSAVRNALIWRRTRSADQLSNITGYVLAPGFGTFLLIAANFDADDANRRFFDDTVPVFQAGIVTGLVNQTVKVIFGRRRPFAEFGGVVVRAKNDFNTSFFSGHTALAFSMATAAGTVASIRGYSSTPYIWGGGLAFGVATAYLRIGADAHYFTDVLTGAIVGSAIGIAIPLLFHRSVLTDEKPDRSPTPRRAGDPFMVNLVGGAF